MSDAPPAVGSSPSAPHPAGYWKAPRILHPISADTGIFIYPGYRFKIVDALLTNFHLPKSTLLMLVSALGGRERMLHAYRTAVDEKYRFFSFGDAMLIQ